MLHMHTATMPAARAGAPCRPNCAVACMRCALTQVGRHVEAHHGAQLAGGNGLAQAQEGGDAAVVLGHAPQGGGLLDRQEEGRRARGAHVRAALETEMGLLQPMDPVRGRAEYRSMTQLTPCFEARAALLQPTCGRLAWKASSCSACWSVGAAGFSLSTCLPGGGTGVKKGFEGGGGGLQVHARSGCLHPGSRLPWANRVDL